MHNITPAAVLKFVLSLVRFVHIHNKKHGTLPLEEVCNTSQSTHSMFKVG